jgi:CheY-like chemotaxis protein
VWVVARDRSAAMGKPILIVDDSEDDVLFLKRVITRSGIVNPVHCVFSAQDAMAYLDGSGQYTDRDQWPLPGVIMLDLKLPGVHGFELLEWCRAHQYCKDALIIVLSGSGDVPTIRRAYELGANSFLTKPARSADFENLMRAHPQHWERKG